MRNLFIVLAKVVGLLQIPTAINLLYYLNSLLGEIVRSSDWVEALGGFFFPIFGTIGNLGLILGLAWAFLFRTTWIANRVCIPEGEIHLPGQDLLLYVGIKLLGLSVLVAAIPGFLVALFEPRSFNPDTSASHFWVRILPCTLEFVFGLVLVGKTKYVMELISGDSKPKEEPSA